MKIKMKMTTKMLEKLNKTFITSVYKKPSDTGLFTHFSSFIGNAYKRSLIKTLVDRIFRINNTWTGFSKNIESLQNTLQKNGYPTKYIY